MTTRAAPYHTRSKLSQRYESPRIRLDFLCTISSNKQYQMKVGSSRNSKIIFRHGIHACHTRMLLYDLRKLVSVLSH